MLLPPPALNTHTHTHAGILIEDQLWPKSCGHVKGKRVAQRDEAVGRIRAAADARCGGMQRAARCTHVLARCGASLRPPAIMHAPMLGGHPLVLCCTCRPARRHCKHADRKSVV